MNWLLNLIPIKIWKWIGISAFIIFLFFYIHNQGYKQGVLDARLELVKESNELLNKQIEETSLLFDEYLKKLDINFEYEKKLETYLLDINTISQENKRLLEDAITNSEDACSRLSNEYYRLYQNLYNKKPE